jgi:exodeoxyribonuclease VII small subunit
MSRESMAKEKFEEALSKLEGIVERLEQGDISLEESLKLFEEGVRLSRFCSQKLDEAEKKVEILLKDDEGKVKAQRFEYSKGLPPSQADKTVDFSSSRDDEEE